MSIRFVDPETKTDLRSTEFARRVLSRAALNYPELRQDIAGAPDWRKWYLRLYAKLAIEEGRSKEANTQIATLGLSEFQAHLADESGKPLLEEVRSGWQESSLVRTVSIVGSGKKNPIRIARQSRRLYEIATEWVESSLAEPGLQDAFEYLDSNPELDLSTVPLFAVAGAAEFAPTEDWLSWGGTVAVVARPNPKTWERLISIARASGGKLLVPVLRSKLEATKSEIDDTELSLIAGLDITEHYKEIANWFREVSDSHQRIALGLYAYTPSTNHVRVQGVQDALVTTAMENLPADKLTLSWLATPTDSAAGPERIGQAILDRYERRPISHILRDTLLGIFGAARAPSPKFFEGEKGKLCLIDASVQQQGPSYSFSKRTQRWRAYLAHYQGYRVSYAVAPPARTDSVLSHKILRASYRGAPLFGVKPFDVDVAKSAMAAVLVRDIFDPKAQRNPQSTVDLHTESAIHGGLWRIPYRPRSVWIAATALGITALLRRGY